MVFGNFDAICTVAALPLCSLLGPAENTIDMTGVVTTTGIFPRCLARSIQLANFIIFQVGNVLVNFGGLVVLIIIILNIRSKITAIGRSEMLEFFGHYLLLVVLSMAIDSGAVPPGSVVFPYFVSFQSGLTSACCWCLMVNGLTGFQLWKDGTPRSMWGLRFSMFLLFLLTGFVALMTFKAWCRPFFSPSQTTGLFVVLYLLNAIFMFVYVTSQIVLTLFILHDLWAFGAITLGASVFAVGQVLLYTFSTNICTNVKHYLDGLFFASLTNLFATMMIYKYWTMVTTEDLEFSVSYNEISREVKQLMSSEQRINDGNSEDLFHHEDANH